MLTNETELEQLENSAVSDSPVTPIQKRIETAFIASGQKVLNGKPLMAYSASREVAAQAMGLHYAYVDQAGQERFKKDRLYPGAIRDVAIVMWLCIRATEDDIDAAGIDPRAATRKAVDWAKGEGILDVQKGKFWDAFVLFFQIMDEVWVSQSKPVKKNLTSAAST